MKESTSQPTTKDGPVRHERTIRDMRKAVHFKVFSPLGRQPAHVDRVFTSRSVFEISARHEPRESIAAVDQFFDFNLCRRVFFCRGHPLG